MSDIKIDLFRLLYKEYGAVILSKKQTAKILNMGVSTLDKLRSECKGPNYKQDGLSNVKYNLHSIVDYILDSEIQTLKWKLKGRIDIYY